MQTKATRLVNRRRFLQTLIVASAATASHPLRAKTNGDFRFGKLVADPRRILDLPAGFSYEILSRKGEEMDDGLLVPGEADGMAAFAGESGNIVLICNHENPPSKPFHGPFGLELERLHRILPQCVYDRGWDRTPGTGGSTTIVYDPRRRRTLRRHLSLAGTELNCAGGPTPWGSWLSCEESFGAPGESVENERLVSRERRHGYVFEVPSAAHEAVRPIPLTEMGRFEHEAAAVDPRTGIVYMTEDRLRSLLYRFVPNEPKKLHRGGQLQALAVSCEPRFDTRNWVSGTRMVQGKWLKSEWVDLDDVDSEVNDLRLRGHERGAARFARGEGICYASGEIVLTCTIGGPHRLGQVFSYRPAEGGGSTAAGHLQLVTESTPDGILRNADNLTMSPWGDLVICEDTADHCGLIGLRPDGTAYPLADNAYTESELAGICFSPDGSVMFVNIQVEGLTLAITGPWQSGASHGGRSPHSARY